MAFVKKWLVWWMNARKIRWENSENPPVARVGFSFIKVENSWNQVFPVAYNGKSANFPLVFCCFFWSGMQKPSNILMICFVCFVKILPGFKKQKKHSMSQLRKSWCVFLQFLHPSIFRSYRFLKHPNKRFASPKASRLHQNLTIPETNSSNLKMDGWNTIVSFWDGLFFRCELLVSGSVMIYGSGNVTPENINKGTGFWRP